MQTFTSKFNAQRGAKRTFGKDSVEGKDWIVLGKGKTWTVTEVTKIETKTEAACPTTEAYGQLQKAYGFFNAKLFGGKLPEVMLAQHRHPRSYGYWGAKRWAAGEVETGELALNPEYLKTRPLRETLSTLVHEQCHVWQTYFGTPPKAVYHNAEWADKMEGVGLMPSHTGLPGGKRTGPKMTHYIIEGGPFDVTCKELLDTGFTLTWGARLEEKKESKSGKRTKFVCPGCEAKAWGKDDLRITCGDCEEEMKAAA